MKYLKISATILLVLALGFWSAGSRPKPAGANGDGFTARACINPVTTRVVIGKDVSGVVVATSSLRAWTRISMDLGATTTAELTFANGATSTAANATILLNSGIGTSSSSPFIDFGLNTLYPYTGAVQGLSTFGTSTVLVTQCSY